MRKRRFSKKAQRKGMTLIEVIMAVTILAVATLSIAGFMGKFARIVAATDVKNTANELASQRLEQFKNAPRYGAIDTLYPGTQALASPYTGYTRQTLVTHTGGGPTDLYDYRTITVIVSNPRLSTPIRRSTMIAAF